MLRRLLMGARSLLLGWTALFVACFLVMRLVLFWTAPLLGPPWRPTVRLAMECAGLALTGWIIGRWNRRDAVAVACVFAILLAASSFGLIPDADVPWLFRLTRDTLGSARYLESWFRAVAIHVLLFGSLIAGARFSRGTDTRPVSLKELGLR